MPSVHCCWLGTIQLNRTEAVATVGPMIPSTKTGRAMDTTPYGSWSSPVNGELLTERTVRLADLWVEGDDVLWVESRPAEAGRHVVVRSGPDGAAEDVLPSEMSARTTVHEYGWGALTADGKTLVVSNFADQRLWVVPPAGPPRPITPEPPAPGAWRYADTRALSRQWLVAVRERHLGTRATEVANDLAAIPVVGGDPLVLVEGHDFFAAPRRSPDGLRLAWVAWDHPNMPWDGTELWVGDLATDRDGRPRVTGAVKVAGGLEESVSQPRWSPDNCLHWVSDRTGWWNLYADDSGDGRALAPRAAEFSGPDWAFGQSSYAFLADGRLVAAWTDEGVQHLSVLDSATSAIEELATPFTRFDAIQAHGRGVVAIAASATESPAVVRIGLDGSSQVLRRSREIALAEPWISRPEFFAFPTSGGRTAHAYWYPPTNPDHKAPDGERPPLVVFSHGGPTSSASPAFNLAVQFWTSRGLGVVDVDYGGSTGYGRAYRRALDGNWGEVDVDDCVAAALHLARRGDVDRERLVIRGGSAGGFTALCALAFRDLFVAGTSLYGVADLAALATHTHKFESRYLDRLVGPWPETADRYRDRSPLHHAGRLSCPVLLLQGLEDRVVPPAQAEGMVAALRANGLPFAYVAFPGEQHGFRQAESIRRAAELELSFYGQILGFRPHGRVASVLVENMEAFTPPLPPP